MTNEMQHFIQEAIDRIADGIRGQWTVRDEAFLKNIISDGLQPLRVEIENFEAIERERDLLKDDQATITALRERLAAAEDWTSALSPIARAAFERLVRYRRGEPMIDVWSHDDPEFTPDEQRTEDRRCVCNELIDSAIRQRQSVPQPQAETAEVR